MSSSSGASRTCSASTKASSLLWLRLFRPPGQIRIKIHFDARSLSETLRYGLQFTETLFNDLDESYLEVRTDPIRAPFPFLVFHLYPAFRAVFDRSNNVKPTPISMESRWRSTI